MLSTKEKIILYIQELLQNSTPNCPIERTIIYKVLFAKYDREKDYEIAWMEFEERQRGNKNVI